MKLKSLHLTNFRGFEQLDIEFKNRLAVFIGVNGAGKSSVLDAICHCLIQLVSDITDNSVLHELNYTQKDLKKNKKAALFNFELQYKGFEDLQVSISIVKKVNIIYSYSPIPELINFFKITDSKIGDFINEFNFPILTHYKGIKEENTLKTIHTETVVPQHLAYHNAFFHSIIDFSEFIAWFKEEEELENQLIILSKDFTTKSKTLTTVRNAILQFLFKLNGALVFSDLRINRETNNKGEFKANGVYTLTIKKGNEQFDLSQLSDGERIMIMLVSDIARRLTIANPSLDNPLEGEGIVLIDEIDVHLHPQWQREVIPALLATFPNLQFIVTTHSPQVLSKVKKESIYILEDGQLIKDVPYTYGRNASAILFEIFGVTDRPSDIQDKINRCSQLLEEEKYDKAKVLLKELTDLLGEHDEAVVGARTQLLFDNQMVD